MDPPGRARRRALVLAMAMVAAGIPVAGCGGDGPTRSAPVASSVAGSGVATGSPRAASATLAPSASPAPPSATLAPSATPAPASTLAPSPSPAPASATPSPSATPARSAATTPDPRPAVTRLTATPAPASRRWAPKRGTTWQWQLSGRIDLTVRAAVFDLDVDDTSARTVTALHRKGRHVVCYVDVGTWESYRADAGRFAAGLLGRRVDGWPDERWLDIRAIDRLAPILRARLDACARKGFDAVEPDWLNAYEEDTGFPITRADCIRFARWVAKEAHRRGLSVAQKNAPGLVTSIAASFDFAITEDCAMYDECAAYRPYVARGRAVLDAEYALAPSVFCRTTQKLGVSAIRKRQALGAWRRTCP